MSSGTTTRLGAPYPIAADSGVPNIDIAALAAFFDSILIPYYQSSTAPVTPVIGTFWWDTDATSASYGLNYWNGTAWSQVNTSKLYVGSTAPSIVYPGLVWINTSTNNFALEYYNGSAWVVILPGTGTNNLSPISSGTGWVAGIPVDSVARAAFSAETTRAEAAEALLAALASPAFTGSPTAPTKTPLSNNTGLATNAYVDLAVIADNTAAKTLTNKRITKRVLALSANSATPAINTDLYDVVHITAQTASITSFTSGLSGTPVDGDTLHVSVTGTTSVALTFGTSFASTTVALPAGTIGTTRLDMDFRWDSVANVWLCIGATVSTVTTPLSSTQYAPSVNPNYTVNNSTLTAVDTTNLTTSLFTVPASGKIKVSASFPWATGAASTLVIGMKNHSGGVNVGPIMDVSLTSSTSLRSTVQWLITGLTASSNLQLDLAAYGTGIAQINAQVSSTPAVTDYGPIDIIIEAA